MKLPINHSFVKSFVFADLVLELPVPYLANASKYQ